MDDGAPGSDVSPKTEEKRSAAEKPSDDVVVIHGKTDDGALKVIRKKSENLYLGEMRPVEHGKPVNGDIVRLKPREEQPMVCDVVEEISVGPRSKGPARVANERYRKGWNSIWGKERPRPQRLRSKKDKTLN